MSEGLVLQEVKEMPAGILPGREGGRLREGEA